MDLIALVEQVKTLISGSSAFESMVIIFVLLLIIVARNWEDVAFFLFNIKAKKKLKNLKYHHFFSDMQVYKVKSQDVYVQSPVKKQMVIHFLEIKLQVFSDGLYDFIQNPDIENMREEKLEYTLITLVATLIKTYNQQAAHEDIPQYFIDTFGEWHQTRVNRLLSQIRATFSDLKGQNNLYKMYFVLSDLEMSFLWTIEDATKVMNKMNGQIARLRYNGKIIGE